MSLIRKHLSEPWFSLVKERRKIIEGRLYKDSWEELKVGDRIQWFNGNQEHISIVKDIKKLSSFKDILTYYELNNVLPGISSIESGLLEYRVFYSEQDEVKYGVIAITLE